MRYVTIPHVSPMIPEGGLYITPCIILKGPSRLDKMLSTTITLTVIHNTSSARH